MRRLWPIRLPTFMAFGALVATIGLFSLSVATAEGYLSPQALVRKTYLLSLLLALGGTGSLLSLVPVLTFRWSRREVFNGWAEHLHMREKLANTTSLLHAIISETPGLVYAKDLEGRLILANPAAVALVGRPWSEIEGLTAADYFSDTAQAAAIMANDRRIMDGGIAETIEDTIRSPLGFSRKWLSTKAPLRGPKGDVIGLVAISVDITERKAAADRLHILSTELARMGRVHAMGELGLALAHELNQPLATIMNHIAVVEHAIAKEAGMASPDIEKRLRAATDQTMRAGQIVKRLRTFVESAQPEKQPENVADLVSEAVDLISGTISQSGSKIALNVEDRDVQIMADRVQIQNAIINLVTNASEAMEDLPRKNREISITVRSTAHSTAEIIVEDGGPGISAEKRIGLFDRFPTAHNRESGLGIPISLRILTGHGGDLTYDDSSRGGARLVATLPRADFH